MSFRLLPQAEHDLQEIADYIALDDPRAADKQLHRFAASFRRLGEFPELGTAHDDVRPGMRLLPVGPYLILYRIAEKGVEIVRVIHGAREWQELLNPSGDPSIRF